MQHLKRRIVMSTVLLGVLAAPVLIWSGGGMTKLHDVVTIGSDRIPHQMTLEEKEAFSQHVMTGSQTRLEPLHPDPMPAKGGIGGYVGMTPAEIEKLERSWQDQTAWASLEMFAAAKREPVSTIENVSRPPGIEGMTPEERAKLEAYRKMQK